MEEKKSAALWEKGRLQTVYIAAAAGLLAGLGCGGMGFYIFWHEGRAYWLAAALLGLACGGLSLLCLVYLWRQRAALEALEAACRRAGAGARPLDYLLAQAAGERAPALTAAEQKRREIGALQNQMDPHFLYNTLDSIRGLALSAGAEEIARMTEALSAFFRYSAGQKGVIVTLKDELKNLEAYMQIQAFRFENRIRLEQILDLSGPPQELYVPKMILQPLVENSIVHGLEGKEGPGLVTLRITQTEKRLLISVCDDGLGMDGESLARLNARLRGEETAAPQPGKKGGIALQNVARRIALHFGPDYGLRAHSVPGLGTEISVTLPVVDTGSVAPEYLKLVQ